MQQLHSYLSGAWVYGQGEGRQIRHAVTGEALYQVCSDGLPLAASLSYARSHGGPALAHMTFPAARPDAESGGETPAGA